ncbi:serine hydrolase domain-containing protein [Rheinheimera texasensis]|uniref:serine hydrolase domain-containing protein n=1 Tax=Rheinheimera texasensis TaxID=306205 RepID=UPI0012FF2E65|nr:serine hydrolase domain-containing protein [Rheinheimera texasensis]
MNVKIWKILVLLPVMIIVVPALWYLTTGWQQLPDQVPAIQQIYQDEFSSAAQSAFLSLQQSRAQQQMPALTAAVAWQGKLIWAGAAGYADVSSKRAASLQSQFRIGSTSKAVTATAIARAVAAGTLQLDVPIASYKASLPNPQWQVLTLRQLMSHTAGLPGYEQNDDWRGVVQSLLKQRHFPNVDDGLQIFDHATLQYQPGHGFLYSSFDVNLASSVLQSASKTPFLAYLTEQLYKPLQLKSLGAAHHPHKEQVTFYQSKANQVKPHWPVDLSQKLAGGGLAASSIDLVTIGSAWFDVAFIPPQLQQEFWTPQRLQDGSVNPQNYALGFRRTEHGNLYCDKDNPLKKTIRYVHHGGVSDGAQSWLVIYPDYQLVLAMNTNIVKEDFCDFALQAAGILRPFLQQIDPSLF